MRVTLEITNGPAIGKKALLCAGQVLQVGRTEWADFSVPHDGRLSGVHFALESEPSGCYVRDLGSSNGTLLVGRPLSERTRLSDGDEIRAGQTVFRVRIEEQPAGIAAPGIAVPGAAGVLPVQPSHGPEAPLAGNAGAGGSLAGTFTAERLFSGLTVCRGSCAQVKPLDLAVHLEEQSPMHLLVLPEGMPAAQLGRPVACEYLLDWLPEESRAKFSPAVFSPGDEVGRHALLAGAWGKDAAIALFSRLKKAELLAVLRPPAGAFVRPSILAPQLAAAPPAFVENLLRGIDAVLLEGPSDQWQLFGRNDLEAKLLQLGLKRGEKQ